MLRELLKERLNSPADQKNFNGTGDFLDQIISDMDIQRFLSEDFAVRLLSGGLFAIFESISVIMALAFQLLSEHPSVLQELTVCWWSLSIYIYTLRSIQFSYYRNYFRVELGLKLTRHCFWSHFFTCERRMSTMQLLTGERIQIRCSLGMNTNQWLLHFKLVCFFFYNMNFINIRTYIKPHMVRYVI